jgi:hypothetical protein
LRPVSWQDLIAPGRAPRRRGAGSKVARPFLWQFQGINPGGAVSHYLVVLGHY